MREILFRARRVDKDQWAYGYYAFQGESHKILLKRPPGWGYHIDPETVGQYTGLTDKNGTKIFEGDIVEYQGKRYSINYLLHYARFSAVKPNNVFCVFAYRCGEVIGNIYDNPELLGGADDECKKV